MASENVNAQQLSMFEPAGKLVEQARSGERPLMDGNFPNTPRKVDNVLKEKAEEIRDWEPELYEDMRGGIKKPITTMWPTNEHAGVPVKEYRKNARAYGKVQESGKPNQADGHHRLAVANKVDPSMEVPVQHATTIWGRAPSLPPGTNTFTHGRYVR